MLPKLAMLGCFVTALTLALLPTILANDMCCPCAFPKPMPLLIDVQVFRTEHYSHAIKASKKSGPLGLIAVVVCTIAAVSLISCAIAHPGEIQNTLVHPQQSVALVMSPAFPWRQIAYTGLLSTDFVIYIEV